MMPKGRGDRSMGQQGSNHVINRTDMTLGFSILGRSVWAGKPKLYAMVLSKRMKMRIVEFFAIVTLNCFDMFVKLCLNKLMENSKYSKHIGLVGDGKGP